MTTLDDFLSKPLLESFKLKKKLKRSEVFFKGLFGEDHGLSKEWLVYLSSFLDQSSLSYWNSENLLQCLSFLEKSPLKTIQSLSNCERELNVGIGELYRFITSGKFEKLEGESTGERILEISNKYHPSYLRLSEHCYNNILVLFHDLVRNPKKSKQRELKIRFESVRKKGLDFLLSGYDDRVRNAIAHGEVCFETMSILYGPKAYTTQYSNSDFTKLFFELVRNVQTMFLAISIFIARNEKRISKESKIVIPYELACRVAFANLEREEFNYLGSAESKIINSDIVLNLFLVSEFNSREALLLDAFRLSRNLIDIGVRSYRSFYIEITPKGGIPTLIKIDVEKLVSMLNENVEAIDFNEGLDDNPLIWTSDSKIKKKYKTFKSVWKNTLRESFLDSLNEIEKGIYGDIYSKKYRIREVKNCSASGTARVHIYASIDRSEKNIDLELVRNITKAIIARSRIKFINSSPSRIENNIPLPKPPVYIWVTLFQEDGAIQWLQSGGWVSGNIVCIAEWIGRKKLNPILVKKPQDEWEGIRFQFEMDKGEYNEAVKSLNDLIVGLNKKSDSSLDL